MSAKFAADGATWQTTEKDRGSIRWRELELTLCAVRTVQWPLIDSDPHINRVISYMCVQEPFAHADGAGGHPTTSAGPA